MFSKEGREAGETEVGWLSSIFQSGLLFSKPRLIAMLFTLSVNSNNITFTGADCGLRL